MSDDLDLRGIDHRQEPDPQFRAALQRRLAAIVAGTDPGSVTSPVFESEQQLVPVKEIYVPINDSSTSETRNRRRPAMAAAAVVAVIGVAAIAINSRNSDDDVEPAPAAEPTVAATTIAPTTVAPTPTVAPPTKTVSFPVPSANDIPVTFTVPDDWVVDGPAAYVDNSGGHGVVFDGIANIYADGCQWVLLDPPVGPTVDDLVAAWANLPGFAATAAVDVTVDGYAGKPLELTVPDYDLGGCKVKVGIGPVYALYDFSGMSNEDAPGYFAWFRDPHFQIWVLDVDGTRLVITANKVPTISPQNRAALEELLASIQIG